MRLLFFFVPKALHKALRDQDLGGKLAEALHGDGGDGGDVGDGKRGSDRSGHRAARNLGFQFIPEIGEIPYEHDFYDFPSIGKNNPQLLLTPSFFRGVGIPPTRYPSGNPLMNRSLSGKTSLMWIHDKTIMNHP